MKLRNTIIGDTIERLIIDDDSLIIKVNGLILIKTVCDQIKENQHANQVAPHIHRFIMKHEEAFEHFMVSIEIYSVATFDVLVVK